MINHMKLQIIEDGPERLRQSEELQVRLRQLRGSIRARYAAEFSEARFLRRCWLRWRMVVEYRRERKRIVPSPHSLYSGQIVTSGSDDQRKGPYLLGQSKLPTSFKSPI